MQSDQIQLYNEEEIKVEKKNRVCLNYYTYNQVRGEKQEREDVIK